MSHSSPRQVVIVTGASSGIGREAALQFGQRGYRVGLLARRAERLEAVAEEIASGGGEAMALTTDVSDRLQVNRAVQAILGGWGRVNVLVNNAGFAVHGLVQECQPADFERQMAVNYLGAVYCTTAVLTSMIRQRSGCIVNVSSISGKVPSPLSAGYCASKFALEAFSASLRQELRGKGISVVTVCPGYTEGEFDEAMVKRRPLERRTLLSAMPVSTVARGIVKAVERPRREIVMPGPLKLLAVAYGVAPGLVDWWQFRFRDSAPASSTAEGDERSGG